MDNGASSYRRFLNGDDNGLVELIHDYHMGMLMYINSIVNNVSDAEEIMEKTFVKIATRKPKFSEKSTFKTWLYSIARNTALDHIRHNRRISKVDIDEVSELSDEINVENRYIREEQKIEVHRAMRKLIPDYQQVIYLMWFEGFDTEEVSTVMHKTKKQVGDLIYRAKKSLKSELEKAGFKYEKL